MIQEIIQILKENHFDKAFIMHDDYFIFDEDMEDFECPICLYNKDGVKVVWESEYGSLFINDEDVMENIRKEFK